MSLHEALQHLEDEPDTRHMGLALGALVHDVNTQLGTVLFATDDVRRMSAVLIELGRRQDDESLTRAGQRLEKTWRALEACSGELQEVMEAAGTTARKLR